MLCHVTIDGKSSFIEHSLQTIPQKLLAHGNIVVLESVSSCKSLRVYDDGRIDGTGGEGALGKQ